MTHDEEDFIRWAQIFNLNYAIDAGTPKAILGAWRRGYNENRLYRDYEKIEFKSAVPRESCFTRIVFKCSTAFLGASEGSFNASLAALA